MSTNTDLNTTTAESNNNVQQLFSSIKELQEKAKEYLPRAKALLSRAMLELQQEVPPLMYCVLKRMTFCPVVDKSTAAVDMLGNFWYNPLFIKTIEDTYTGDIIQELQDDNAIGGVKTVTNNYCIEIVKGVLMHEAMHILNRTLSRVNELIEMYDKKEQQILFEVGNYAYDLIINRDIIASGHQIIKEGIIPQQHKNDTFVYELDCTTQYDSKKDIKRVDITRFTGEKAFDMFLSFINDIVEKLIKQTDDVKLQENSKLFKEKVLSGYVR